MWSKSGMTPHSRNDTGRFLCCWWKELMHSCGRCWIQGMICPSQSVWCNAVVLVWKKDMSLHFYIDFCHLNACTKKDSYPLLRIQEALESLVGTVHFSCLDLKSRFWQIKMDELSKQYTAFTISNLGFFKCDSLPFGLCNAPAIIPEIDAKLPQEAWI